MKFERVDENTIRCFISNEELEGYQIDYKDFVSRSEKAREVVRDIIEQAAEEVGYKPPRFAFDMSIMVMPDEGLVLTFSESDPLEGRNGKIWEYLAEMRKAIDQAAADHRSRKEAEAAKQAGQEMPQQEAQQAPQKPEQGIFEFANIRDVMDLAEILPGNLRIHSELYRMNDKYYLYVNKGTANYKRYGKICIQTMEFARLYGADDQTYLFLKEHGECLIAERALGKLQSRKKPATKKGR